MAKETKTKLGETPQGDAGAPAANTEQVIAPQQNPGDAAGSDGHPNPERAASDAAEAAAGGALAEVSKTKAPEPKVSDALAKAAKALLKSNPALEAVYMTADGTGFATKNDADNHARNLKNKAVTPVKR